MQYTSFFTKMLDANLKGCILRKDISLIGEGVNDIFFIDFAFSSPSCPSQ